MTKQTVCDKCGAVEPPDAEIRWFPLNVPDLNFYAIHTADLCPDCQLKLWKFIYGEKK